MKYSRIFSNYGAKIQICLKVNYVKIEFLNKNSTFKIVWYVRNSFILDMPWKTWDVVNKIPIVQRNKCVIEEEANPVNVSIFPPTFWVPDA